MASGSEDFNAGQLLPDLMLIITVCFSAKTGRGERSSQVEGSAHTMAHLRESKNKSRLVAEASLMWRVQKR